MVAKVKNYTDSQTTYLVEAYTANPTRETVDALAKEMGKTVKSIIGKLSREKVYIKREYETKTGDKPITKTEIAQQIADLLEVPGARIAGIVKASKADLNNLKEAIDAKLQ